MPPRRLGRNETSCPALTISSGHNLGDVPVAGDQLVRPSLLQLLQVEIGENNLGGIGRHSEERPSVRDSNRS